MTASARNDITLDGMAGCTDDDHAFGCPCGMGGDPIPAKCWVCGRHEEDGWLVEVEGEVRCVCPDCWSRDEVRIPLDYSAKETT